MIGSQLAHFRITDRLGEGGMGVVYRAEDTKLGREVAIKVLPEAFTADAERLARFEREARVLASLNHPRIAGIYEIGLAEPAGSESDGAAALRPVHFLVMEIAEGETLAERIDRGPVPLDEALPIALQLCEALESAHAQGIVHRDLKPANVKLAATGGVKVLDFGLAKAFEGTGGEAGRVGVSHSPTLTAQMTQAGVLLGTAAYMSPEQAAGKEADQRADIWAFGVVLLEMLSGRRAFEGETVTHVLAAVLKDDPALEQLPAGAPPPVSELLERCLRKDARRRMQSIGDARVQIEDWIADPRLLQSSDAQRTRAKVEPRRRRALLPWLLVGVLALALALILGRAGLRASPEDRSVRISVALPAGHSLALDDQDDMLAISPDGRRQVFVLAGPGGARSLFLRDFDQADARELPGTENAGSPIFSPDGEWVAFFASSMLYKVPVGGGPPVVLSSSLIGTDRGASWGRDGYIYLSPDTASPLSRIHENGGVPEPVTQLDEERNERTHRWPHALPDGRTVIFASDTTSSTEFYDDARIEAIDVETGRREVLVEQSSRARYLADGHLVFARGGVLYAMDFDPESMGVSGSPIVVAQGIGTTVASGAAHFDVSESGTLLYAPGDLAQATSRLRLWTREGEISTVSLGSADPLQLAMSPEGRRVALVANNGQRNDLWVADLERGTSLRLSFEGNVTDPVWSPDGREIFYGDQGQGGGVGQVGGGIFRKAADGSGEAEQVWPRDSPALPMHVSPDGTLLAIDNFSSGRSDIWIVPLDGEEPWSWLAGPFDEYMAQFSPDGHWMAYMSFESGRAEVYVRPFPGPGGKWQISVSGGNEPRWSRDGRELFYRSQDALHVVEIGTSEGFVVGQSRELLSGVRTGGNPHTYSVGPDAREFLYLGLESTDRVDRIHLVLGWNQEVRELTAPKR